MHIIVRGYNSSGLVAFVFNLFPTTLLEAERYARLRCSETGAVRVTYDVAL